MPAKLQALVVDDHPLCAEVASAILETGGYRVETCLEPEAAIALCAREGRRFHVVVLDFAMPNLNGADLARALRAGGSDAALICLSAMDVRADALLAGCDAFVRKPVRRRDLLDAIDGAFRGKGIILA